MSTPSGHSLLQALHSRQRSRISWSRSSPSAARGSAAESAFTRAFARPRVESSSSRVAMYDGHMTPVADFRHRPMFMHRSAAPRIPPVASKLSLLAYGGGMNGAASRRFSVMAGAVSILSALIPAAWPQSPLRLRLAPFKAYPQLSMVTYTPDQ